MKVKCPRCRQPTEYSSSNVFRPFCSERCQTIDLGAWADEQYRVPVADAGGVNEISEAERDPREPRESAPPKHQLN